MEADKNVELMFEASSTSGGETKIYLHMTRQVPGDKSAPLHLMMKVFDKFDDEWILRSEPELYTKLETDNVVTIGTAGLKRVAPTLGIKLKVSNATDPAMSEATRARTPLVNAGEDTSMAPAACNCCTNGNMRCCGAAECCEGSNWCRPTRDRKASGKLDCTNELGTRTDRLPLIN